MCCGRSQTGISSGQKGVVGSFAVNPRPGAPGQIPAPAKVTSLFEYVGETALTVVSPVTRRTYRFAKPGARLEVDARDRSWIAFVPNLARVRSEAPSI